MADNTTPSQPLREFLIGFGIQGVSYFNLTLNFRAVSHEQYMWIGTTALLQALISYTIVRRIADDKGKWMLVGMAIGGCLADLLGTYLTRDW